MVEVMEPELKKGFVDLIFAIYENLPREGVHAAARTRDWRPRQPLTGCSRRIVGSYHGGFLVDDAWKAVMDQFGMRDEARYWRSRRIDPVVWFYTLVVERA